MKRTVKTTAIEFFCGTFTKQGMEYLREKCLGESTKETIKNLKIEADFRNDINIGGTVTHYRITGFKELALKLRATGI